MMQLSINSPAASSVNVASCVVCVCVCAMLIFLRNSVTVIVAGVVDFLGTNNYYPEVVDVMYLVNHRSGNSIPRCTIPIHGHDSPLKGV